MRPPQNAGGIPAVRAAFAAVSQCFNEAPAKRGGIPAVRAAFAAVSQCFNEAPAKRGGIPSSKRTTNTNTKTLQ